ncbi:MAG: hypothetical protein JOZ60_01640, partial [Verrucomicrobia bacterium]|nr:hypothetical protein [Verrucomicrobiota bacterium]
MKKALVTIALVVCLLPMPLGAASYSSTLSLTGFPNEGGNWLPLSFFWGPNPTRNGLSDTLTWTTTTDSGDQYLISAAKT